MFEVEDNVDDKFGCDRVNKLLLFCRYIEFEVECRLDVRLSSSSLLFVDAMGGNTFCEVTSRLEDLLDFCFTGECNRSDGGDVLADASFSELNIDVLKAI